jgi:hypothetical protein
LYDILICCVGGWEFPLSDTEVEIIAGEGEIFAAIVEIGQMEEIWVKRLQPARHS